MAITNQSGASVDWIASPSETSLQDALSAIDNHGDEITSLIPNLNQFIGGIHGTYVPYDTFGRYNNLWTDEDAELEIGLVFSFADAGGGELPGMLIAFDDEEVTVDFNHPLAGRKILFDVMVHRVEPAELH